MQAAPHWPTLPGEGRVPVEQAADATKEARGLFEGMGVQVTALIDYIRSVVLRSD